MRPVYAPSNKPKRVELFRQKFLNIINKKITKCGFDRIGSDELLNFNWMGKIIRSHIIEEKFVHNCIPNMFKLERIMVKIGLDKHNQVHCEFIHQFLHELDEFNISTLKHKQQMLKNEGNYINNSIKITDNITLFCVIKELSIFRHNIFIKTTNDLMHILALQQKSEYYDLYKYVLLSNSNIDFNILHQLQKHTSNKKIMSLTNTPLELDLPDFYRNLQDTDNNDLIVDNWLKTFKTPDELFLIQPIKYDDIIQLTQSNPTINIYKVLKKIHKCELAPPPPQPQPPQPPQPEPEPEPQTFRLRFKSIMNMFLTKV